MFFGRNDAKAETPGLWLPHAKGWLIGKGSDAGRDWGHKEKGTTENEMAGWHHWLDGREFEWTLGVGDGQGGLACCDSRGRKGLDTTEWLKILSSSFFLELFLYWSLVVCWAPTDQGSSFFSVLSFYLFMLFMEFSRQEYWSGLPFPSPMDQVLSELSTMTHPSWVAHSFIELDKAMVLVITLTRILWLWFSFYLSSEV